VYGWWQWNKTPSTEVSVRTWPLFHHGIALVVLSAVSVGLATLATSMLDASYLYLDAFITVFSVFTTVLVAHKVRENWLYWMVINGFAAFLYFEKSLYLTCILFVLYLGFAVYGYISWGKEQHTSDAPQPVN
jgi:nicotinamide mononucleotide transporter